jgi:hypothetical protein
MSYRLIKYMVIVIILLVLLVTIPFGVFWKQHEDSIQFINANKQFFTSKFANSREGQMYDKFIEKIHNSPEILLTLRQNEKALRNGEEIVNIHNQELGYYEDEVQFPLQCKNQKVACESIRTALTAAREGNMLAYKLAFQYWVEELNNQPDPVEMFNQIFNACVYMDNLTGEGTNGFRGCKILSENIIQETLDTEPNKDLGWRIQFYAIERSIANGRYAYSFFEETVNRFFNDRKLRKIIQSDFESISAFLWLPESLRDQFNIDYQSYQKAKTFAIEYPWFMEYILGIKP